MADPVSPSSRPSEPRLRDRLAEVARRGPPKSRARLWLWLIFGIPVLVVGLLQILGITSSPVADKVLRERQEREKGGSPKAAPADAPPAAPGAESPGAGMGAAPGR